VQGARVNGFRLFWNSCYLQKESQSPCALTLYLNVLRTYTHVRVVIRIFRVPPTRSCTPSRLPCSTEGDEGRFLICLSAVLPYNRSGRSLKTWPCRWSMLPNVYFLFIQFVQMFIFFSFNLSKCSWSRTEQKHENLILAIEEVGVKLQSRS
jgi:hypothetical protein